MNKDLILREELAIQRTIMANQTTFLAFLRTSMYFLVAGLTIQNLAHFTQIHKLGWIFYGVSVLLLATGLLNYNRQRRAIEQSRRHIGQYQMDYWEAPPQ